jgi:8-oxo-dGTP pyrophosphatase MutT (NUDIX family)
VTQAYLAVLAPAAPASWAQVLLAQKRVVNAWWGKRLQQPAPVNQAGQWALPGGKMNSTETPLAAARREFLEETGVELQPDFTAAFKAAHAARAYPFNSTGGFLAGDQPAPVDGFYLVVLGVSSDRQAQIRSQAQVNLKPEFAAVQRLSNTGSKMAPRKLKSTFKPGERELPQDQVPTGKPFGWQRIADWELSDATVVERQKLVDFLGRHWPPVDASKEELELVNQGKEVSQDITWYGAMATHLTTSVS